MHKCRRPAVYWAIAWLIFALASLEAPELATLTDDSSNDPAQIEIRQEDVLRSASSIPLPMVSRCPHRTKSCALENLEPIPHIPASTAPARPGRFLLRLFVLQRK
jgi:hypothetical protein